MRLFSVTIISTVAVTVAAAACDQRYYAGNATLWSRVFSRTFTNKRLHTHLYSVRLFNALRFCLFDAVKRPRLMFCDLK